MFSGTQYKLYSLEYSASNKNTSSFLHLPKSSLLDTLDMFVFGLLNARKLVHCRRLQSSDTV